jgi:hypothetical protein
MGIGVLSWETRGWGEKLATHLHLLLRLRMSGYILLLPLHAFMVWTGKTLPFIAYMTV